MICTLASHPKTYSLTLGEWSYSILTGLRAPYFAERHLELSRKYEGSVKWGHRLIGTLEMLPIIGMMAALIEKITCLISISFGFQTPRPPLQPTQNPSIPRLTSSSPPVPAPYSNNGGPRRRRLTSPLTLDITSLDSANRKSPVGFVSPKKEVPILATGTLIPEELISPKPVTPPTSRLDKMIKNTRKALKEHVGKQTPSNKVKAAYFSEEELSESLELLKDAGKPVRNSVIWAHISRDERKGIKKTMEDFSFEAILDEGILSGIFDGHAGIGAAAYANLQFPRNFAKALKTFGGNAYEAMRALLELIDEKILTHEVLRESGCTALICFLDRKTHILYTLTLGDTEAFVYRKNKAGELKAIPASCIRDWSYQKDALRASIALKKASIATSWPAMPASELYFPSFEDPDDELNVSRALGDAPFRGPEGTPGLISKPKITALPLEEGDIVVLASDGYWNVIPQYTAIDFFENTRKPEETSWAELQTEEALRRGSADNVTVITWEIQKIPGFGPPKEESTT